MNFIDFHNSGQVQQHDKDIKKAQTSLDGMVDLVRELQARVQHLTQTCRAMWILLQEVSQLTEQDLLETIHQVEQLPPARACPRCSRPNKANKQKCLYCGAEISAESAFDLL